MHNLSRIHPKWPSNKQHMFAQTLCCNVPNCHYIVPIMRDEKIKNEVMEIPQVNNPKYYSVFLLEKLASSSIKKNHISYSVGAFAIVELSSGLFVEMYGISLSTD